MRRRRPIGTAVLLCVTLCGIAHAALTTGALSGIVRDSTGAVVSGVAVELTVPHSTVVLQTATNAHGEYRFLGLVPGGGYELSAAAVGFERVLHANVTVALGVNGALDIVLRPAVSQAVTIVAPHPLVDTSSATLSTNITAQQFDALPTRRDFQQLTVLAPGVRFDYVDPWSPTISGATHLENDYVIEGLSTRDPMQGRSATNLTMDFVQEVQVLTGALTAEYGRATGGVVNVVTKSGSNAFHLDLSLYYANADWAPTTVTFQQLGIRYTQAGHDRKDAALAISGPVLRDRIWFFGAFDPRSDITPFGRFDPAAGAEKEERITDEERVYAGKVTTVLTPSQSLTLTAFGSPKRESGWLGYVQSDASAALQVQYSGSRDLTLRHDWMPGSSTFLETSAGRHSQEDSYRGIGEMQSVPLQYDIMTDWAHGGVAHVGSEGQERTALSIRVSQYHGRHEFRYGAEVERNSYSSDWVDDTFLFFGPTMIDASVGKRDMLMEESVDYAGHGSNNAEAAFAQDRVRLRDNLTFTIGLRWEQQVLSSARGVTIAEGKRPDGSIQTTNAKEFRLDDNWAPRLSIVWDPTSTGRAKVFAAAGRYFEAIPVNMTINALNGYGFLDRYYYSNVSHTSDNWYNPNGSPLNGDWILFDTDDTRSPAQPRPFDPLTKLQYEDEYTAGVQTQFGSSWMAGARIVQRELHNVIEDTYALDPANPRIRRGLVITNPGSAPYGEGLDPPSRRYVALELNVQKQLTNRWQVISSFVSARERGDYDGLYSYTSNGYQMPNVNPDFQAPRFQQNAYGPLHGDRPYSLKLYSSYEFPGHLTVSEGFEYDAGRPISKMAQRSFTMGNRILFFTPRGSEGRTPDVWTLDLHAGWRMPFIHSAAVSLIADVFNTTNNHGVLTVDENYIIPTMPGAALWRAPSNLDEWGMPKYDPTLPHSPYYKTPSRFQEGRQIQAGLRITY